MVPLTSLHFECGSEQKPSLFYQPGSSARRSFAPSKTPSCICHRAAPNSSAALYSGWFALVLSSSCSIALRSPIRTKYHARSNKDSSSRSLGMGRFQVPLQPPANLLWQAITPRCQLWLALLCWRSDRHFVRDLRSKALGGYQRKKSTPRTLGSS